MFTMVLHAIVFVSFFGLTFGIVIPNENIHTVAQISRRGALASFVAASSSFIVSPTDDAHAASVETIDMDAINAARGKTPEVGKWFGVDAFRGGKTENVSKGTVFGFGGDQATSRVTKPRPNVIKPILDPPPLLRIGEPPHQVQIPRVGYSLYKTPPEQAGRCVSLALRTGVRHFDLGTQYGSNRDIAPVFKKYLDIGEQGVDVSSENLELLEILDATHHRGDEHSLETAIFGFTKSVLTPPPVGSIGRKGRRDALFISHKLSNSEQSTDGVQVRRRIKNEIATLGVTYLDLVSIHSPLTDSERRIETYGALMDLCNAGLVKSVGVCNYGVGALEEIAAAGLEFPVINQLELSPFNQHTDVIEYCQGKGIGIGCSAWSRLSSADGPQDGWAVVAKIAQNKGMTKAQVLVRWSLQKGYVCVPRSSSGSKLERVAIAENSYGGVNPAGGGFVLTEEEMRILDGLDEGFKAGKLGRRDGWGDEDVKGPDWDPTFFV